MTPPPPRKVEGKAKEIKEQKIELSQSDTNTAKKKEEAEMLREIEKKNFRIGKHNDMHARYLDVSFQNQKKN